MKLYFTCPDCGGHTLEEVLTMAVIRNEIVSVRETKENDLQETYLWYGTQDVDGGEVTCYQCRGCGYSPKSEHGVEITEWDELGDWLKDNCPQCLMGGEV